MVELVVVVPRHGPAAPRAVARPGARDDVYAADRPGLLAPIARHALARIYVPNSQAATVDVIDQRTAKNAGHFAVGQLPQHVVPSWDLKALWVTNDQGNSLTPIDPRTAKPGPPVSVTDPYNLYFTADGRRAIVVAEARRQLDFRDPHTMALRHSLKIPTCPSADHMDFTRSGRRAVISCEFGGRVVEVDLRRERVIKTVDLRAGGMPQDVKLSPDGRRFYVADMHSTGSGNSTRARCRRLASSRPARAPTACTPAATPRRCSSLTAARARSASSRCAAAGCGERGTSPTAAHPTWADCRPTAAYSVWPQPGRYSIGHTGILR